MACHLVWSNTCGGMWSNGLGQRRENDEEHYEDCVNARFQLARAKLDRNGEGGRKGLGTGNCSTNDWDRLELELAWSKKSSSYFGNSFPIYLLSGISNTSIFKVHDTLHCVNFLVMKTFSNNFRSTLSCER